ncbi:MAG: S-methyl-5'-thioinosine phosphorylase [Gammaproteobacteria bacterium]|nr:S-methyl-5'-thioinosine phosphorylase [Gammaproteobacteria bacterium]
MQAIILGTSLRSIIEDGLFGEPIETPFGTTSSNLVETDIFGPRVLLLARHGKDGGTYAHTVNYRANMWALKDCGVNQVLATATVGGISAQLIVGDVVIPDQIVDYTFGRDHTYFGDLPIKHYDFTYPFTDRLRQILIQSRQDPKPNEILNRGTYGCTQGPRLETRAEITRLKQDGCDLVGMTLMPEASLARELELDYAAVCLVVNAAAGLTPNEIDLKHAHTIATSSIETLRGLLGRTIQLLN